MIKRSFTEAEAAYYTGYSRHFLRQDRKNGPREKRTPGPRFIKIGRSIRYLKEDLDAWLDQYSGQAESDDVVTSSLEQSRGTEQTI